jgi:hypothetical protein
MEDAFAISSYLKDGIAAATPPGFFPTYQTYLECWYAAVKPPTSILAQGVHEGYIRLLSFGTGITPRSIEAQQAAWGALLPPAAYTALGYHL